METIFITFIVIILLATIISGIYMLIYRRNINKALMENNGKHIKMPDVRSVVIVILLCVLFYGVYSSKTLIDEMNEKIDEMSEDTDRNLRNLVHDVESIKNTIYEDGKLVADWHYYMVKVDNINLVERYKFEVLLKTFTEDTKVSLSLNDISIELNKNSAGKYVGTMDLSVFNSVEGELYVLINEGGKITTEHLEYVWIEGNWRGYMPYIDTTAPQNCSYLPVNKMFVLDERLEICLDKGVDSWFEDVYLEIDVQGEDVKKIDIGFNVDDMYYYVPLEESLPKVETTDTMHIYVVGIDSLGYTHRTLVNSWSDGQWYFYDDYYNIYDKDGNSIALDLNGVMGYGEPCE